VKLRTMSRDHRAHCQPHLSRLGFIARGESEIDNTYGDVVLATGAIVAEATEATRDAGMFLLVRRERLVRAADEAIAAARDGNPSELRCALRRFSTLASAIWTVHDDFHGLRPTVNGLRP
jgi:hypothetical protein